MLNVYHMIKGSYMVCFAVNLKFDFESSVIIFVSKLYFFFYVFNAIFVK